MIDWEKSMQQTYEYYIVDPGTWRDKTKINSVKSCNISRDSTAETLGSASIDVVDLVGECYIRVYMVAVQNGVRYSIPMGTFLVQTPSSTFDGKSRNVTMDAYTPLLELKENPPPLGYYIPKKENIMVMGYQITREHVRAPVVETSCPTELFYDFVANTDDTWLSLVSDLIAGAKYQLDLDELGRVLFAPKQDIASLQPVWTYNDDNSSILYPSISMSHDLYGIPNVVEVVYSNNSKHFYARVVNDDSNSPTSTVNRGREIIHRVTDPNLVGDLTQNRIQEYAEQLLRNLSTIEYTATYMHGYNLVRPGDCVRLNYSKAGLDNVKAKVISQSIKCEPGCPVTEKAVFSNKLWG